MEEVEVKKITVILVITIVASIVTTYGFAQTYQPGNLTKFLTLGTFSAKPRMISSL
jgi:uncharacterized membrane protein